MTTSTTKTNPMGVLRQRLSEAGVNRKYLNSCILPDWWDDAAAQNPAGFSEVLLYIAHRLGLTVDSLTSKGELEFYGVKAKFKKRADTTEDDLQLAKMIAFHAARVAASACRTAVAPLPEAPEAIREQILQSGVPCVALEALLDYCWGHGIPVIHVGEFPAKAKKMDGLSARIDGRPVIVLSKNIRSKSAMAFILAHELGHLALGHLPADMDLILDQSWDKNESDWEEEEANAFASHLLTGMKDPKFSAARNLNAEQLAAAATKLGNEHKIAPGVVALNYGWTKRFFPVAFAALKVLEPGEHAAEVVGQRMVGHIDEDLISGEAYEWLVRLTGASAQILA
jgi:hypothetical protein